MRLKLTAAFRTENDLVVRLEATHMKVWEAEDLVRLLDKYAVDKEVIEEEDAQMGFRQERIGRTITIVGPDEEE